MSSVLEVELEKKILPRQNLDQDDALAPSIEEAVEVIGGRSKRVLGGGEDLEVEE